MIVQYHVSIFLFIIHSSSSFLSFYQRLGVSRALRDESVKLHAQSFSKTSTIGSKFLPEISEDELSDLFKEFNITDFDLNQDPEIKMWEPSKEFFETYGFQNMTERYRRKTMDIKIDFYSRYRKPILPQYKTFIADFLALTHIQTVDARYQYDALHAFGLCTQYYTIMKGYTLPDEIDVLFDAVAGAVGLDPARLRADAKRVLAAVKELPSPGGEDALLDPRATGELAEVFARVRSNRFFKYTDAWGVGLGRVMELVGADPKQETFARWARSLRWVFAERLAQSWDEFTGDQVKMQGVEAMQKQLLVREKRRAAARLERQAAGFEDRKRSIAEMNEAIAERRAQIIEEQKRLKKRFEPDNYARILAADPSVTPAQDAVDEDDDRDDDAVPPQASST